MAVLIFVSLAMFGNYYVYDALSPVADLLVKASPVGLGFTDDKYRPAAGDLQFPEYLYGLDRRHADRPHRLATLDFAVWRVVPDRADHHRGQPAPAGYGGRPVDLRDGGGVVDCRRHRRTGAGFGGKELSFAFGIIRRSRG